MALTNVVRRLTAAELAREPRHCGVVAYFDGWGQATGRPPMTYPRPITTAEARHWREGWARRPRSRRRLARPPIPTSEPEETS